MQPWIGDTSQKDDINHGDRIAPTDAAIALAIVATGAHDPAADVSGDNRITSPGRAHDPAGGGWEHRIMSERTLKMQA